MRSVATVYRLENGAVMVFDEDGEQIPELQGVNLTADEHAAIRARSTPATEWHGFGEDGPCVWAIPREGVL